MSDHNANQYPEFNAQSVADGYWEVYHDYDCGEAFDWFGGAICPKCGFRPDMQSIAARKIHANQVPIKLSFEAPCSACGDGDTEMKHHNHEPLKAVSQSVERMTAEQCRTEALLTENYGWQLAHDKASCGHPRACWQDRNWPDSHNNYDPVTKTSNPPMDYRCVMCEVVKRAESAESSLLSSTALIRQYEQGWRMVRTTLGLSPEHSDGSDLLPAIDSMVSSAALVRELAQLTEEAVEMFGLFGKLMGGELTKVTAWRKAAESLLSDPAVKKVLEK